MVLKVARPFMASAPSSMTVGFSMGRSCDEILSTIYEIVAFANTWKDGAVIISSQDIATAFDTFQHSVITRVLVECGLDPLIVVAFMREYTDTTYVATVKGCITTEPQPFLKAIETGDSGAADVFNKLIDQVMRDVVSSWKDKNYGFLYDPAQPPITHLWWADNLFLIALSVEQWSEMFTELSAALFQKIGA